MTELNDIDRAFYKRLKTDSDELVSLQHTIKCQKNLVVLLSNSWLDAEELKMPRAKQYFIEKTEAEIRLQRLERDEQALLKRMMKHVN